MKDSDKLKTLTHGLDVIKQFHTDQSKLDAGLRILSPTGTNIIEFGDKLEEAYINLLSEILGDESYWVSWYVYDNDFGTKKMQASSGKNKRRVVIDTPKKLLEICIDGE